MNEIILKVLASLNLLLGLAFLAGAVAPSPDAAIEKKPIIVVIYVIWSLLFIGLSVSVFRHRPVARKWTINLYGFATAGVLWKILSDVLSHDKILFSFPLVTISVYLLFIAFFIWPVVFMLRPEMKTYFINFEENRKKAEEEAARSSLKR